MAQNLSEYLKTHPCKGFDKSPHYFPNGDFVKYFFRDERAYSHRLDDVVTVYLGMESGELVGCKIKGVKHILESAGNFGVLVDGETIKLGLFFFSGAAIAKDEFQKQLYEKLKHFTKDATLDRSVLQGCHS